MPFLSSSMSTALRGLDHGQNIPGPSRYQRSFFPLAVDRWSHIGLSSCFRLWIRTLAEQNPEQRWCDGRRYLILELGSVSQLLSLWRTIGSEARRSVPLSQGHLLGQHMAVSNGEWLEPFVAQLEGEVFT